MSTKRRSDPFRRMWIAGNIFKWVGFWLSIVSFLAGIWMMCYGHTSWNQYALYAAIASLVLSIMGAHRVGGGLCGHGIRIAIFSMIYNVIGIIMESSLHSPWTGFN